MFVFYDYSLINCVISNYNNQTNGLFSHIVSNINVK